MHYQVAKKLIVTTAFLVTTTLAHADTNYGRFGAWSVSRSLASNQMSVCQMMQNNSNEDNISIGFMTISALPDAVGVNLLRPIGGFGKLKNHNTFSVTSSLNQKDTSTATYTIMDDGFVASGEASTKDLRVMAEDVRSGATWLWIIDAPAARVRSFRVPFEGFVPAMDAFAQCGADIGVRF